MPERGRDAVAGAEVAGAGAAGAEVADTRWLSTDEQRSWRALVMGMTLLTDRLDADLRAGFDISLSEYEILVRLSEQPGRSLRMAQLAEAMSHSRSRITHTVQRMEDVGLLTRTRSTADRRGVIATMTEAGWELLVAAAPLHVAGVRDSLVDIADPEDLSALGRVMNAVCDRLVLRHPEIEIRRDA